MNTAAQIAFYATVAMVTFTFIMNWFMLPTMYRVAFDIDSKQSWKMTFRTQIMLSVLAPLVLAYIAVPVFTLLGAFSWLLVAASTFSIGSNFYSYFCATRQDKARAEMAKNFVIRKQIF